MGIYRNKSYTDLVTTFLHRKTLGVEANIINRNNPTSTDGKPKLPDNLTVKLNAKPT